MSWRKTGDITIDLLICLTIFCVFATSACCYADIDDVRNNIVELDVGAIASIGTLMLALLCSIMTIIYKYSGTAQKTDRALELAISANDRSIINANEISSIKTIITSMYEDVKTIKNLILNNNYREDNEE